ncbi:MAG: PilZ domain-containing protein [Burkholderiales bacterium]|nr:PilZ domain-containing protein [Burkholderiales bacterium]
MSTSSAVPESAPSRPAVLSLTIRERAALYAAYMPFLHNGGLFVPTTKSCHLGDEIFLLLSLMQDEHRYPVAGKVVWITPAGVGHNRTQGVGLQFPDDDAGRRIRLRIEEILGTALASSRATHTI